ncbi:spatacsin [Microplitis demolitor]|uniref:spatacsin n=1 Tax=Microplitis demolitor TaxID=69319 RepID=UPI0004CDA343|nr:spatacsin [Microplitis demolitor]
MESVGGIPVECLTSGELAGVWSGWSSMKDREVVRESSAKGTHINLAYKFLCYRKNLNISEAKLFFNNEVDAWIDELLNKQQIHRASHILRNVGQDPIGYIRNICIKLPDHKIREYLVNHIINNKGFSDEDILGWNIVKCLKKYKDKCEFTDTLFHYKLIPNISIQDVLNIDNNVRESLLTELYFITYDSSLSSKLKTEVVWDYLLLNNKTDFLIIWIDIYYNKQESINSCNKDIDVKIFSKLNITLEMIESIETSNASFPVKLLLLNHLARYGIFLNSEQKDIRSTLSRLFSASVIPSEFNKILSKEHCRLCSDIFTENIFSIVYHQKKISDDFDHNVYLQEKKLQHSLHDLSKFNNADQKIITNAIFQTIYNITHNFTEFLQSNPYVALILIIINYVNDRNVMQRQKNDKKLISFKDYFCGDAFFIENLTFEKEVIDALLKCIPYLKDVMNDDLTGRNDITMYQLINGFNNLNIQELFKWRNKNDPIPTFTSDYLIKKYGHKEKLTYKYYLKELRPSMAGYILQKQRAKISDSISSKIKSQSAFHAHIYGLKNLNDSKIISTCISFIEYLGIDSECLRFHTTAANYIKNKIDVSINDLLESVTYHNSYKDLAIITNYLEESFKNECTVSMKNVNEFISALKSWDFIVQFCYIHNTKFPSLFLKYLANNNFWFEFVLVGHIFGYPLEQIFHNAELFKNQNIREHLLISLNNSHLLAETYSRVNLPLIKLPDTRQLNLLRMSRKNDPGSLQTKINTNDTEEPLPNVFKYFPLNQKNSSYNYDLWLTILKCHQSQDPPGALLKSSRDCRSAIPIILAACYEPSATAAYCYSWLVISVNDEDLIIDYTNCLNDQIWSAKKVSDLFRRIISLGYIDTLSRGFKIFMPDNPLSIFFYFLVKCIKHADFESSVNSLNNFLSICSTFKSNKMIDWTDVDTTYLNNEYWIATVATECILSALGRCSKSIQIQTKILRILVENNFNSSLNIDGIEFKMLWEIVTSLERTNVKIDFTAIKLIDNCSNITQEFKRCIQLLIDNEDFTSALELSKISNLPCSKIIIDQYRCEFKSHSIKMNNNEKLTTEKCDLDFWKKYALDIKKYNVNFEDAAGFFVEHAEKVNSHKERYEILQLALNTLKPISTDQQTIDTIEMAMWKSCILAGPEAIEISNKRCLFNKLKTELLSGVSNLRVSCVLNDSTEENAINELINKFIDIEDLETALRISAIFNYKHNDLKILMLCLSIAELELSPYELSSQHKILLENLLPVKPQKYSLLRLQGLKRQPESSINLSASYANDDDNRTEDETDISFQKMTADCIELLDKLVKNLQHGTNVGNKILLLYKLSVSLKRNYQSLLKSKDPIEILYDITGINCPNKFDLIKDVIIIYRIKDSEVAKFLAGEIILHITRQVEDGYELSSSMWGYPLEVHAHLITDLCSDPSILGWELMKSINIRLGQSHGSKRDIATLKIIIELLIRAHNYFTAGCHMEGIAYVLRKCQSLANTLQHLKLWSLLVRLLTGIGRFTEMNYVFNILKENDQFEFLLGKGLDKVTGLKMATMEFCKKQCPDNKELFNLVANHFQLYTEVAIVWENKAKMVIRELLQDIRKENIRMMINLQTVIKLTRNDKTEKKLQSAITYFTDATEHYLQDNKLNTAHKCSHQAQLVALQLSLLNGVAVNQQVTCLLNLSNEEINKALCQTLTFPQTFILIQAYSHNADWPSIIYHHVITNGEIKFLKDFLTYKRLTNAIVQDCVCKYRMEKNITKQMTQNMQSLICELSDVECKYVLASQLGFKNIIEAMLSNSTIGSYLKDTVWKQGFNPQEFIGENFRS